MVLCKVRGGKSVRAVIGLEERVTKRKTVGII
jgi:hypothetical protein